MYSERELDMCFDQINKKLDEIHEQTKTTNGRVGRLENWQNRLVGGLAVIIILVVPVLIYVVKGWIG